MIQIVDHFEQGFGGDRIWRSEFFAVDADFLAAFYLAANIDLGGRIVADKKNSKPRAKPRSGQVLHLSSDFGANFGGDFVAVQDGCGHGPLEDAGMKEKF